MYNTEIINKYLHENPNKSVMAITRKLIEEQFPDETLDNLRKVVAFVKNSIGNEYTEIIADYNVELPESYYEEPIVFNYEGKIAVISDVHVPFHDKFALTTALNYIEKYSPDVLILNGDVADFYAISRYVRDVNYRDIAKELKLINQFLDYLRSKFTKIVFKEGNHELRLFDYIANKAPEFGNLGELKLQSLLRLKERNIDYIENRDKIQIDKLTIIHGNEITAGGIINVARVKILRAMSNVLFGHHHVTQEFIQRTIDNKVIGSWSVGCLCGLSPEYAKFNSWNHGFALIETLSGGGFEVKNLKIINNKVI